MTFSEMRIKNNALYNYLESKALGYGLIGPGQKLADQDNNKTLMAWAEVETLRYRDPSLVVCQANYQRKGVDSLKASEKMINQIVTAANAKRQGGTKEPMHDDSKFTAEEIKIGEAIAAGINAKRMKG